MFVVVGGSMLLLGICLGARTRRVFSEWRAVLGFSGLFSLGLAAYLYLPVGSMTDPPVNWGYPRTVDGFFHVLSRGQYDRMHPADSMRAFARELSDYLLLTIREFGWPGLLSATVPFWFVRRMAGLGHRWIWGILGVYVCLVGLIVAVLNPSSDTQSLDLVKTYYSASYVPLALLTGMGLVCLETGVAGRRSHR